MAEMEPDVYTFKQGSNVDIFPHTTVERANVRKHASLFRFLSLSFAMKASAWIAILSFISLGVEIAGEQSESEKGRLTCLRFTYHRDVRIYRGSGMSALRKGNNSCC